MGLNFIGIDELLFIQKNMGLFIPPDILESIPVLPFSENLLESKKHDYILILGIPFYKDGSSLTLLKMREHFGWDPEQHEPCFYNQDWYLNEDFAKNKTFEMKWFLIKKEIHEGYRGKELKNIDMDYIIHLPSAVLCSYTFFAYYFFTGCRQMLWKHDFIWCGDKDHNFDPIYVGRYVDPNGHNKNGFNIHRHLSIKLNHSIVNVFE